MKKQLCLLVKIIKKKSPQINFLMKLNFSQEKNVSDVFMVGTYPAKTVYNFLNERKWTTRKKRKCFCHMEMKLLLPVFQKTKQKNIKQLTCLSGRPAVLINH